MSVSSYRCCMFVSCVHPVAVLNAAFCMACSLLMLVEDARGDHIANIIFQNFILMADKHNIPKENMHNNGRILPDHIVCKIT